MALFYGQKTFSIVKKNYIKKQWGFLLSDLSSCRTKTKLQSHKNKICENKDFCNIVMPSQDI